MTLKAYMISRHREICKPISFMMERGEFLPGFTIYTSSGCHQLCQISAVQGLVIFQPSPCLKSRRLSYDVYLLFWNVYTQTGKLIIQTFPRSSFSPLVTYPLVLFDDVYVVRFQTPVSCDFMIPFVHWQIYGDVNAPYFS